MNVDLSPLEHRLESVQTQRRLLSIGSIGERIRLDTASAAYAHALGKNDQRDTAIDDAKEAYFGLLKMRTISPQLALIGWGVAELAGSGTLQWRLAKLSQHGFTQQHAKHHRGRISEAIHVGPYARMLIDLHLILAAIYEKRNCFDIETRLFTTMHADPHIRRTLAWIESLYNLAIAVRDNQDIPKAIATRETLLAQIHQRDPWEPSALLDLYGIGILGIASHLGREINLD